MIVGGAADMAALFGYPALASLSLVWVFISMARYASVQHGRDMLVGLLFAVITCILVILSLSTGGRAYIDWLQAIPAIRYLFLVVLALSFWYTVVYLADKFRLYRRLQEQTHTARPANKRHAEWGVPTAGR